MLGYRHGFHAGNFADVHKHIILLLLLESLLKKSTPFCYVDSHAGAARYDLQSEFAQKNREFENGIVRLLKTANPPAAIASYLRAVETMNATQKKGRTSLRYYPGSPALARQLLRPQDQMILMELHSTEAPKLKKYFANDHQVSVHHRDGYEGLNAMLPPEERRGLVFIDPSYEIKDEFTRLTEALIKILRKWPTGIYAVWYPVQGNQPTAHFYNELRSSGIKNIYLNEISVVPDTEPNRLSGSGVIIINPPWRFDQILGAVMDWLAPVLDRGSHAPAHSAWLVPE
ncbi:MAG: 23S rRNA (adenine(2030)-N(6))-methyltransferase RlmJ [Gammaproteobacteria bacterium]|nr:23S rRNA (adenine(2030)-N(6))-methyltransferase RlmJ [Gammaproteobacteria bacterium]